MLFACQPLDSIRIGTDIILQLNELHVLCMIRIHEFLFLGIYDSNIHLRSNKFLVRGLQNLCGPIFGWTYSNVFLKNKVEIWPSTIYLKNGYVVKLCQFGFYWYILLKTDSRMNKYLMHGNFCVFHIFVKKKSQIK